MSSAAAVSGWGGRGRVVEGLARGPNFSADSFQPFRAQTKFHCLIAGAEVVRD